MDFARLLSETWEKFVAEIVQLLLFAGVGLLLCVTVVLIPTVIGGFFRGGLGYVRTGSVPDFDELWNFDDYLEILLLLILQSIGITIGYMLLVIPGVVLSVLWLYSIFFLLDRNLGVVESLGASKDAVIAGGFLNHLAVFIIVSLLSAVGISLWFGTLLTTPFGLVFLSLCYQDLDSRD